VQRVHGILIATSVLITVSLAGCGGSSTASTTTTTTTVTATSAPPQINTAFFKELEQLDDKFVARVSAVPEVRAEIMDRRNEGPTAMAHLGHDLCTYALAKAVEGGSDMALIAAGNFVDMSMFIMGEHLSDFVKRAFVQSAAETYCPDNPAGVR
jgi:hypothetical protein